ncbi:MAG: DUF488 domain-containing protein [Steroidobacteraceae bacterium]
MKENARPIVFTIGHSTRALPEFIELLEGHGVTSLIDVRTVPRSRSNPQFNRETLPGTLEAAEIGYAHVAGLGGFRRSSAESPNRGWRNASFRGYADYMQTNAFSESLAGLIERLASQRVALMCAEAVPWRCHRSLIADALVVRGIHVEEIVNAVRTRAHPLTSFARVDDKTITYPLPESRPACRESPRSQPACVSALRKLGH